MQTIVYIFIALAGLGLGATGYFGFGFTPVDAFVTALAVVAIAITVLERALRERSEARLEKAIGELSRLLSTNAHAGGTLSQRVAALAEENAGKRLEALEADIAVLGNVVRQVGEAVAEIEDRDGVDYAQPVEPPPPDPDTFPESVIPPEAVRQALDEARLVCHLAPIVRLPQRRPYGYLLLPRLALEDGEFADAADFMPRADAGDVVRRIEALCATEAVVIARRSRTSGLPTTLLVPLSRATLENEAAVRALLASLEANTAIAENLSFALPQADFRALSAAERATLAAISRLGATLAVTDATTLKVDFGDLQGLGVRVIALDANRFAHRPEAFTDFHAADVAAYARRYGIELVGTGVLDEGQLLRLFEDGIVLASGPHVGAAGPARPDLAPARAGAGVASRAVGA